MRKTMKMKHRYITPYIEESFRSLKPYSSTQGLIRIGRRNSVMAAIRLYITPLVEESLRSLKPYSSTQGLIRIGWHQSVLAAGRLYIALFISQEEATRELLLQPY